MITGNRLWIPVTLILFSLSSCKEQADNQRVERGFYYWKSRLTSSEKERNALANLNISKLYIKLFDVDWDAALQSVQPVAKLEFDSATVQQLLQQKIQLIPVVFVTNESLLKIDSAASILLAQKIMNSVQKMIQKNKLPAAPEFQLDCDWTISTRKNYFLLVDEVKRLMQSNSYSFTGKAILSATIRLHQIKYSSKSGIPGVDKGLLMCYNMGNLKNPATKNSILDTEELKKYLGGLNNYPLPLDVALPIFSWSVYFSNSMYKGIISNIPEEELTAAIGKWDKNRFTFSKDTVLQNIPFQKNDQLRLEESTAEELLQTASYVSKKLSPANKKLTILFYHADELLLNKHPQHELETLFRCFD